MSTRVTLSGSERKRSIIEAARPLFATRGFHATSIRDISREAGVSEALIYKHFPSKEALYDELLDYAREILSLGFASLSGLEYGARTLVLLVFMVVEMIMLDVPGRIPDQKHHERLLFRSLMGDTTFARSHFRMLRENWLEVIDACFVAATRTGEITPSPIPPAHRMWFVHHLAMALNLCHLSGEPVFEYEASREGLAEQAVLFCLKGIGMTDSAIDEYYKPEELRKVMESMYEQGKKGD